MNDPATFVGTFTTFHKTFRLTSLVALLFYTYLSIDKMLLSGTLNIIVPAFSAFAVVVYSPYGLGRSWIGVGLPHYVALDRKPVSGRELETGSCGKSGIIIRIDMTMFAEDTCGKEYESDHCHVTEFLLPLLDTWFHTNRIV